MSLFYKNDTNTGVYQLLGLMLVCLSCYVCFETHLLLFTYITWTADYIQTSFELM